MKYIKIILTLFLIFTLIYQINASSINEVFCISSKHPSGYIQSSNNKITILKYIKVNGGYKNIFSYDIGTFSNKPYLYNITYSSKNKPINGYNRKSYYKNTDYEGLNDNCLFASKTFNELKNKIKTEIKIGGRKYYAANFSGGNLNREDNFWTVFKPKTGLITFLENIEEIIIKGNNNNLLKLKSELDKQEINITKYDKIINKLNKFKLEYLYNKTKEIKYSIKYKKYPDKLKLLLNYIQLLVKQNLNSIKIYRLDDLTHYTQEKFEIKKGNDFTFTKFGNKYKIIFNDYYIGVRKNNINNEVYMKEISTDLKNESIIFIGNNVYITKGGYNFKEIQ